MPEFVRLTRDDYRNLRRTYEKIEYSYFENGKEELFNHALAKKIINSSIRTRPEFLKDLETPGRELYFFKEGDEIKGFLELFFSGNKCDIIEFVVLEKGNGWGSVMLNKAMDIIYAHSEIRMIMLWCDFAGAQVFWLGDAQHFYNNFKELYLNSRQLYELEGKVVLDLYPSDVELILKGIEQLKFFIDKSMYFKCDKEFLNSKSLDCLYLNQYIYSVYKNCVPKDKQNL